MIVRSFKYRIYPNSEQKVFFAKCFGCVRFFYNKSLDDMDEIYKTTGRFKNITPASYKEDYAFLKEVDAQALCNAQLNRNVAFKDYLKQKFINNKEKPNFKRKRNDQSYTTCMINGNIKITPDNRHLSIPKCSNIRIKKHRDFVGKIKSVTISMTTDNKYYASIMVEEDDMPMKPVKKAIGLDLGIKDLIIDSNGKKYKNQKYFDKSLPKLAREQRKLSKMVKGSNNKNKQRIKVARLYKKINNQKNDYLHKLSKSIIDENQIICIEDLKVNDMRRNRKMVRNILDASWYRLATMLMYKAKWYGRIVVKIPYNYPSSQLCSCCNYQNKISKNLRIRKWTCPQCGIVHDRDKNAANNILRKGIEILTKDGTHPDSLFMLGSLESSSKKPPLF